MNQKLSYWASIAEIISSIGVVITLVFLALGIRENTEVTRAEAYDRNIDSLVQLRIDIARSPELLAAWNSWGRNEPLEELSYDEQRRLQLLLNAYWGIYEKSYYAHEYGTLGPAEWSRFENMFRGFCEREERLETWKALVSSQLTDQFVAYVDSMCENLD